MECMDTLARLLEGLIDLVLPRKDTARLVGDASPETLGSLSAPTLLPSGAVYLLPYRHRAVRAAILEAKFHRNERAFQLLGSVLADYLGTVAEDARPFGVAPFILVPVPLGERRRRERGYNQVEETARRGGIPVEPALLRIRETAPQTSLPRGARLANMEGAFAAAAPLSPHATYIVFDDVMTTGATLAAAAAALRAAGATDVRELALAH